MCHLVLHLCYSILLHEVVYTHTHTWFISKFFFIYLTCIKFYLTHCFLCFFRYQIIFWVFFIFFFFFSSFKMYSFSLIVFWNSRPPPTFLGLQLTHLILQESLLLLFYHLHYYHLLWANFLFLTFYLWINRNFLI